MKQPFSKNKLNVFIATGNRDKFRRIANWLKGYEVNIIGPFDLPDKLASATKVTDEEEKKAGDMQERAILKENKAAASLCSRNEHMLILGQDDTGYLPWLKQEIIDLRTPPAIVFKGKVINEAIEQRLEANRLGNYYAGLTDKIATTQLMQRELSKLGVKGKPLQKFMPIDWKFALAAYNCSADISARVIATWSVRQYISNTFLPETETDDGYVIGKISMDHPLDKPGEHREGHWKEAEPVRGLAKLLKKFS